MDLISRFKNAIVDISPDTFENYALEVFRFQMKENPIYTSYCQHLHTKVDNITKLTEIPFLPIEFFKRHPIQTGTWPIQKTFLSSGTTATGRSAHHIEDVEFYKKTSITYAEVVFGSLHKYRILALLPSYLEQGQSSLVEMVTHFIAKGKEDSGFHLDSPDLLVKNMIHSDAPVLLIGVTYALLDLAESYAGIDLSNHIIIETGGMKGRKKEITSAELHERLGNAFNHPKIFTEYGMTEMMSQAYGPPEALQFSPWAKPLVRDLNDPFLVKAQGTGILNVIDLANVHSCAFIETKDLVRLHEKGRFEVLGRVDNTDIRGCNLLIQ